MIGGEHLPRLDVPHTIGQRRSAKVAVVRLHNEATRKTPLR
jgi:hypothetical protein